MQLREAAAGVLVVLAALGAQLDEQALDGCRLDLQGVDVTLDRSDGRGGLNPPIL
jgi:hypothetical protein